MTAKEVFRTLLEGARYRMEPTCDVRIAGDENKVVRRAGTCFKLTAELIDRAAASGIDLIVTHEPTFSQSDVPDEITGRIDLLKRDLLERSGITVYRFHDHAHNSDPDYIHEGFLRAIGLKIGKVFERESLGICRYQLDEAVTTRDLAVRIRERLGVEFVRIVGRDDYPLRTVCLGLGSVGMAQIDKLFDPGCDLFITGEVGEVRVDEYVRDACYFGENKSILVLGHYSSEYAGMRLLAETMDRTIVPTVYLDCGEVYHGV